MLGNSKIQLKTSSVLTVPLQIYDQDFSFIVNGQEFKTNHLIAELLSPKICENHKIDPTINEFYINAKNPGNFSKILDLVAFHSISIDETEIPFLTEIIEQLEASSIDLTRVDIELTNDNIFQYLHKCEESPIFSLEGYQNSIKYISSHFYELCLSHEEEISNLNIDTLYSILKHQNLRLNNEDQLLKFVNKMYTKDSRYYILYESVYFTNVDISSINEFLEIYDINDITQETWQNISMRLKEETENIKDFKKIKISRYQNFITSKIFKASKNDENFDGIINYLKKSNKEIIITSSSYYPGYPPSGVIEYDNKNKWFHSNDKPNNWICFDFNEYKVIPSSYKIRSSHYGENLFNPRSWVIEGSNDKNKWEVLDDENNSPFLNGSYFVHLFSIENDYPDGYRYIRMRLTGTNWFKNDDSNYMMLDSFELYGQLI